MISHIFINNKDWFWGLTSYLCSSFIKIIIIYKYQSKSFTPRCIFILIYIGLIIPIVQPSIIPVSMTRLKIFLKPWIYYEGNSFEDIHSRHYFSQKIYYFSITLIHIWYLSPSSRSLKFHHRLDSFYILSYGLSISSSSS